MTRKSVRPGVYGARAADCVRRLLNQHGVPENKHSTVVAQVLDYSRQHGYRKLTNESPWTFDEIALLAQHFGLTPGQVLRPLVDADDPPPSQPAMLPALLALGSGHVPCEVMVSDHVTPPPFAVPFVAIGGPGNFVVVPASGISLQAREVFRILIETSASGT